MIIEDDNLEKVSGGGDSVYSIDCCDDYVPEYPEYSIEHCCSDCLYFRKDYRKAFKINNPISGIPGTCNKSNQ